MGIRRFHDKFRVIKSVGGKVITEWHDTKEQAEAAFKRLTALANMAKPKWSHRAIKRSNARAKDLPVGFVDTVETKVSAAGKTYTYKLIKCVYSQNGKIKSIVRYYYENNRKKRTRAQAIKELKDELKKLNVSFEPKRDK